MEIVPALGQIQETMSELPEKKSSDNSYLSGPNLKKPCEAGVDACIATGREERKDVSPSNECNC